MTDAPQYNMRTQKNDAEATVERSALGGYVLTNAALLVRSPGWGSVGVQSCTDDCINELAGGYEGSVWTMQRTQYSSRPILGKAVSPRMLEEARYFDQGLSKILSTF